VAEEPYSSDELLRDILEHLHTRTPASSPTTSSEPGGAAAQAPRQSNQQILYRIVQEQAPQLSDFESNLSKCLSRRGAELTDALVWAGFSMYDTAVEAERTARRVRGRIGRFIAAVRVPLDRQELIVVRQTLRPGHFTVLACAPRCVELVEHVRPISGLQS
jgi:hypothetical protein